MSKASWVVIALALATGTAIAQPGAAPPSDPSRPPPREDMPPPDPGTSDPVGAQAMPPAPLPAPAPTAIDVVLEKVHAEAPTIETVARGTFRRARRAISIGPTIGLWTGAFTEYSNFETALSVGLAFQLFNVPVLPTQETIKALILERVKNKLKEQLLARFMGRDPGPVEVEAMAKAIYQEVRNEVLGLENVRNKTFERPKFGFGIEVNRLFGEDRWFTRMRASFGIWKFSVGLSLSGGCLGGSCRDHIELYAGPELIVQALASKNPRASVLDVFARLDFQATGRDELNPYDQVVLGARYLVDVL